MASQVVNFNSLARSVKNGEAVLVTSTGKGLLSIGRLDEFGFGSKTVHVKVIGRFLGSFSEKDFIAVRNSLKEGERLLKHESGPADSCVVFHKYALLGRKEAASALAELNKGDSSPPSVFVPVIVENPVVDLPPNLRHQ